MHDINAVDAYNAIKKLDYSSYGEDTINVFERILKNDINKYKLEDISSSGYVVDTWEAVLWMLLNTNNYKQAIIGCINLGNDTDTIAAICGSLAGIIYGYNNIPQEWINGLIKIGYLNEIIEKFTDVMKMAMSSSDTDITTIKEDAHLVNDLGLSSVGVLYIVIAIEEF